MRMLKENFEAALLLAINNQVMQGAGNSSFTQALRDVLRASEEGETITIEEKRP